MSIFTNLFNSTAPAPAPAPTSATPMASSESGTPVNAPSPITPGNLPASAAGAADQKNPTMPNSLGVTNEGVSPLDNFSKLWETDPNAASPSNEPLIPLDPAKVAAVARNNDFSKVITPELKQQIESGGPGAMTAVLDVMNQMAQKAYGDSAIAASRIAETAVLKALEKHTAGIPEMIRQQSAREASVVENPIFSHPAAAPLLDTLQKQLAVKYPNATAAELTASAKNYLLSLAEAANPKKQEQSTTVKGTEDWSLFL